MPNDRAGGLESKQVAAAGNIRKHKVKRKALWKRVSCQHQYDSKMNKKQTTYKDEDKVYLYLHIINVIHKDLLASDIYTKKIYTKCD